MNADCLTAIRNARALIFDFDGTLVDSNDIKWRGFELAFADFPESLEAIMAYCRQRNHTARSEKFSYVYEHILGRLYTAEIARVLHDRYAAATTEAVVKAHEIPGASSFLRGIAGRYKTALLSSTPHQVLLEILNRRGMRGCFDQVQGAPVDKAAWLAAFRCTHSLSSDQTVFFGDTPEDMMVARASGCTFFGVGKNLESSEGHYVISDFLDLQL